MAQGNCICWSNLARLTLPSPPLKWGDVPGMRGWAEPWHRDWLILPVTGQDNCISKYSVLLSSLPPAQSLSGPALGHGARLLGIHCQQQQWAPSVFRPNLTSLNQGFDRNQYCQLNSRSYCARRFSSSEGIFDQMVSLSFRCLSSKLVFSLWAHLVFSSKHPHLR